MATYTDVFLCPFFRIGTSLTASVDLFVVMPAKAYTLCAAADNLESIHYSCRQARYTTLPATFLFAPKYFGIKFSD